MTDSQPPHDSHRFSDIPEELMLRINQLCNKYEAAWKSGKQPTVEQALKHLAADDRSAALSELLPLEIAYRRRAGLTPRLNDYLARFPTLDRTWLAHLLEATVASGSPHAISIPDQLGDYKILQRIGGGGMGTVYKALHQRMDRTVAIKVLRAEIQRDPELLRRFDREVRTVARLNHPNIVAALDAREDQGIHYLVTEFVAGPDLDQLVRHRGPLPLKTALDCLLQAARGLDFAHKQGIIHRDIKPANLLRDKSGVVKILDMGLARFDSPDNPAGTQLTQTGMVMGTAAFMAPEQARDTRTADARADLYSLGCTLYFLLIGKILFARETTIDTILSHVSQPIPSLTEVVDVPEPVDALFRKLVAKDPADRFQSAADLISTLKQLSLPTTPQITRVASPRPLEPQLENLPPDTTQNTRTPQKTSLRAFSLGITSISFIALLVFFLWPAPQTPEQQSGTSPPPSDHSNSAPVSPSKSSPEPTSQPLPPSTPAVGSYSLEFDGRSSYAHVPDLIPVAGETYTIEVITRMRGPTVANLVSWLGPDWMTIFVNPQNGWGVGRKFQGNSFLIATGQPAPLHETIHVAGTFEGSQLKLFLNGRLAHTQPVEFNILDAQGGLYIGGVNQRDLNEVRYYDGFIDLVRISQGLRYTADFTPPTTFVHDSQTLILLPFREGRGTTSSSLDPSSRTATLTNTRWHQEQ